MNPKTSNNIFFVALVCILLQTFIVSHTNAGKLIKRQANYPQNVDFSTMKFTKNPPTNGRRFDAAKEAMNLVTTIDLPTCRCVNTLLSGIFFNIEDEQQIKFDIIIISCNLY